MSQEIIVRVFDVVGSSLCVSADDGQTVHDKIVPLLREDRKVAISFEKVETLIPAFLNAAIGQLYGEFPEDKIGALFSVRDMHREDLALLKRVVDNTKGYFQNRKQFDQAWKEEVGDEES